MRTSNTIFDRSGACCSRAKLHMGRQAVMSACLETLESRRLLSFSPAVPYPVGSSPGDVVSADFNGDGRLDLVTTSYDTNSVSVLLGNGNGTFGSAVTSATGPEPASLAVGDFNGDGRLDLVTSNAYSLSVLLGNGNGTFQPPTTTAHAYLGGVAVGDVNADGKLDLVAATNVFYLGGWDTGGGSHPSFWVGHISVMLGNGSGGFAFHTSVAVGSSGSPVGSISLADFNGDGRLDAATVDSGDWFGYGGNVVVAYGNGAGGFSSTAIVAELGSPQSVSAGDIDGDGRIDLIVANSSINIVRNTGSGAFAPPKQYAAGSNPGTVKLADFNGDGRVDLVTANAIVGGGVSVLLGAGAGTFRPPQDFPTGNFPVAVAVGDFNGDGRADVASADRGSSSASVLLNNGLWTSLDAPFITISDVTVTEGNTGTVNAALTVTLSAVSRQTITVNFATADGTATVAGGDYIPTSGTLTFNPGQLSKTINVQVRGDRIAEPTETFKVVLSGATHAFIGDPIGVVTILDDEPTISIDDYSAAEGHAGTTAFTFTVHLSAASDAPVSVDFLTADGDTEDWNWYWYGYGPAEAEATAGTDYQSNAGTITFAAGQTSRTITVIVNGDREAEPDEVFSVDLSNASGAHIADGHALGWIQNDDPFVNVTGGSVVEGHSGTKLLPFTITLSNASDVPVTVNYATFDGTATAASGDYVATSSSVTFAPGQVSKTVNVTVNGDRRGEGDESVRMTLTGATNAGIANGWGTGYILDDEPKISIDSPTIVEGDRGTTLMTFTVTLSMAYDQAVTVNYATQNGTALAGKDYTATSGLLTFSPGQTIRTFTVAIIGDKKREPTEYFYVRLTNASSNAWIGNEYGVGTIFDND